MKTLFYLLILGVFSAAAAEQGAPPVIRWEGDTVEQKVRETGRLEVFAANPAKPAEPGQTSAARLTDHGKRFLWEPTQDTSRGAGGACIPDAAISRDRSALFLLETVGEGEGPFDTRLAILDAQTGTIIRISRFAKVRYEKMLTIPESDDLLLAGPAEKDRQTIVRRDPVSGRIVSQIQVPAFSDWRIMKDFLLIKAQKSRALWLVALHNLAKITEIKTAAPGGLLLPETEEIVNNLQPGTPAKLERIPLPQTPALPYDEVSQPLPSGFSPSVGMIFGKTTPIQLWMEPGGAAMIRMNGQFYHLADRVSGMSAYHLPSGTLFVGLQKQDMIAEFQPERSTAMLRTSRSGQLRPRTRGEIRMLFCNDAQQPSVLVLDHRANFYRLQLPEKGRSWKKVLLFVPGE